MSHNQPAMPPQTPKVMPSLAARLSLGAGTLILGRVVTAACGLIQVPIVLKGLGPDAFGLWVAFVGLMWMLGSLDGGVGFALQNRLGTALARGQEAEAAAMLNRCVAWLVVLWAVAIIAGVPLALHLDWSSWFGIHEVALQNAALPALIVLVVSAASSLPLGIAMRVASAVQETWIAGLWTTAGSCTMLAVTLTIRPSLTGYMMAAAIPLLLSPVLCWIHLFLRHSWLRRGFGARPSWRGFAAECGLFFVPQLGATFANSFLPALVAMFAGLQAAAAYGILHRIYSLGQQVLNLALTPVWPAYTHAAALGDTRTFRRLLNQSTLVCALAFAVPTLLGTFAIPWLVDLWLGGGAPAISGVLLWTVCVWNLLQYFGQPPAILLNGTGRIALIAMLSWLWFALGCLLCPFFARHFGAAGVIGALALCYTAVNLPLVWLKALSVLREFEARTKFGADQATLLPPVLRKGIGSLMARPSRPKDPGAKKRELCILKADRLGDFVLATGAIRTLLQQRGPGACRLVVSEQAALLAEAEFPEVERIIVPCEANGLLRDLLPFRSRIGPALASPSFASLVCLRHARTLYRDVLLRWIYADRVFAVETEGSPLEGGNFPRFPERTPDLPLPWSGELAAHRAVLSRALGRPVAWEEIKPRLQSVQAIQGEEIIICPLGNSPIRDYPLASWLEAFRSLSGTPLQLRILGSCSRRKELEEFASALRSVSSSFLSHVDCDLPGLSFIESIASARLVLSVESAAAHLAVALDKPAVILLGGGHHGWFAPWGAGERQVWLDQPMDCYGCGWDCRHATVRCLCDIEPGRLGEKLGNLLRHD